MLEFPYDCSSHNKNHAAGWMWRHLVQLPFRPSTLSQQGLRLQTVTHFYVIMPSIQSPPLFLSINMTAQLSGCSQCLEVEEMIQKQTNKQN